MLNRDSVIKQIARIVGPDHAVDLKNYELLIIVEIYQVSTPFHAKERVLMTPARTSAGSVSSTTASRD